MSAADYARRAAAVGRRAAAGVGQRPTAVAIVTETWSAAYGTSGATLSSTSTTTLAPNPDVTVTAWTPSAFGGGLAQGSVTALVAAEVRVGPITPEYPGGGYGTSALNPAPTSAAQRVYHVLTGGQFSDAGERFDAARLEFPTPQSVYLILTRTQQT